MMSGSSDTGPAKVSISSEGSFQAHLLEVFLVKLELERLSFSKALPFSNAERALQIENKILKQRLRTLKDNINILNGMIDQIKFGGKEPTGLRAMSANRKSNAENALGIREFTTNLNTSTARSAEPRGLGDTHGSALGERAGEDIKIVVKNNQALKDQNQRLMGINEKLLNESETLRKEIHRLRNLFGEDLYLASPGRPASSLMTTGRKEGGRGYESPGKASSSEFESEIDRLKQENKRLADLLNIQTTNPKDNGEVKLRLTNLSLELQKVMSEKGNLSQELDRMKKELENVRGGPSLPQLIPNITTSATSESDRAEIEKLRKLVLEKDEELKKLATRSDPIKQVEGMKKVIDELEQQNEKLNDDLKKALSQIKLDQATQQQSQSTTTKIEVSSDLQDENVRLKSQLASAEKEISRLKLNIQELDEHVSSLSKPSKAFTSSDVRSEDPQKDKQVMRLNEIISEMTEQKSKADKLAREQKLKIAELESTNSAGFPPNQSSGLSICDEQVLQDLRTKVAALEDTVATRELEIKKLNKELENVVQKDALQNSKMSNLQLKLQTAEAQIPKQYFSEQICGDPEEDFQSDLKKFSLIKKLVECHYHWKPSLVNVAKNSVTKDFIIDVQYEDVQALNRSPNTPGTCNPPLRKRIVIPASLFNGISRVRIDSNASTIDGDPSSDRIYRQSFQGKVKKTEVISTNHVANGDIVQVDEDTAHYFSLSKGSTGRQSLTAQSISGYVLEKKISPDLGKDFQLIQVLFNANPMPDRQENSSNNKSMIKIEKYQAGAKSSESSTLVDPAKVKEIRDQLEEQVMNDIISLVEKQQCQNSERKDLSAKDSLAAGVTPSSTTPRSGKPSLPYYVYRQTMIEDGGSARNIDKVKLPSTPQAIGLYDISQQPEILQKVTVKPLEISQSSGYASGSLIATPQGQRKSLLQTPDSARALVRIEGPGFANKKIEYFRYEKNSEGQQTLIPVQPSQAEKNELEILSKAESSPHGAYQSSSPSPSNTLLGRSDLSFGAQEIGSIIKPAEAQKLFSADLQFAQAIITNPLVLESLTEASIFKLKQDPSTGSIILEHLIKASGSLPAIPGKSNTSQLSESQAQAQIGRSDQASIGYTPLNPQRNSMPMAQRRTVEQGSDLFERIAAISEHPVLGDDQNMMSSILEKFTVQIGDLSQSLLNKSEVSGIHRPSSQELEIQKTTHTPEGLSRSELIRLDVTKPDKKATVELLGVTDPAEVWEKDASSQSKIEGLLVQLGGFSEKLKDEAMKVLLKANSPEAKSANINKELCEFLYILFNTDELEQAAKRDRKYHSGLLMVRVGPDSANGVREFERVEIIDEPGDSSSENGNMSDGLIVTKKLGLVIQRIKIEPATGEHNSSCWKVRREICDPIGFVHNQSFEVSAIDRSQILSKNIAPGKLTNLETQKSSTDCKRIKLTNNSMKYCLSTFEVTRIPNRIIKSLETDKAGQPTDGVQLIVTKTSPEGDFLAEKHYVPVPGICYAELLEKSSANLTNMVYGITVTFLQSGGAILEEIGPSQTNKDGVDTLQRVIMGDAEQFEKVEEVAKMQKLAVEPSQSGIVSTSSLPAIISMMQKIDPRQDTRDKGQRILREKIKGAHKITEDLIVPQAREYVMKIPSCLDKYDVYVKLREYKNASVKDQLERDVNGLDKNQILQDLGGLINLESLFNEISSSQQELANNPIFTVIRPDYSKNSLIAERFYVQNNSGLPLSNLRMVERLRVSKLSGYHGIESLVAQKEIPGTNYSMTISKFKFSKTVGIPLPTNDVKKVFESTQTNRVAIDPYSSNPFKPETITARFDTDDAQGEYLRLLYACHEFLEQYLIVVSDDQFERKVEILKQGDTTILKTKEVLEIIHTKGSGMSINRVILEPSETIEESILITLNGTDGDKSGNKKSIQTEGLSKAMMKLKKKVKTVRSAVGIKLKDPIVEDALDTLARQRLNGELEDLLRIAYTDGKTVPEACINIYCSTQDSARLSIVSLLQVSKNSAGRLSSLIAQNPALTTDVQITKISGIRDIVGLFQSSLMDSKIIGDANKNRSETLRIAGYQQIKKISQQTDSTLRVQEYALATATNQGALPQLRLSKETIEKVSEDEKTDAAYSLTRYIDFICSLLNMPEHLLRPNSLLYERVKDGKLFVDRMDVLQVPDIESGGVSPTADSDPSSVMPNSLHKGIPNYHTKQLKSVVFMREELSIDPRLVEAVKNCAALSRGTSGLDPSLFHDLLSKLPDTVRTVTRRKVNTLGLVEVDSILVDLKSSGLWNNCITERNIIEAKPLGPATTEKELKRSEKIPDSLAIALRAFIYKRKESALNTKTICFFETEDGETSISSLNPGYSLRQINPDQARVSGVGPLAVALDTFELKKTNSFNFEESTVKYNFMLGSIEEMKVREEIVELGSKIKINTQLMKSDLTIILMDSMTIPKMISWDTSLTLYGLFNIFPLKHGELSKADYFIRRRQVEKAQEGIPAESVVYELVKFIYSIDGSQLIIVERSVFPREHDPFTNQTRGRGTDTFALTEDDIYSKLKGIGAGLSKDIPKTVGGMIGSKGMPFDTLVNQSALIEKVPLKSAKSGLFDNIGRNLVDSFDDSDELADFDVDDSVVVNKSMNTLGRFSEGVRRNDHLERITTPLMAILRALEQLPASETKDTFLTEKKEDNKCVFELVKQTADPRKLDVVSRIITERELAVFKPIEIIMYKFMQPDSIKSVMAVTPDMKFSTVNTETIPTQTRPIVTSIQGVPSLAEILENVSKFATSLKNNRFYVRINEDSPQSTRIELYEVIDQGREQIHERIEVPKVPIPDDSNEPAFFVTRTTFTPEGQAQESIEFKLRSAGAQQDQIKVLDTKLKQTVPQKPYHNLVKEKSRADLAGIRPSKVGQLVNTDVILDLLAKEAAINPETSLIRQEIDGDKKIVERWAIDSTINGTQLAERFILKVADLVGSATQDQSLFQLPKYLIQPEKSSEGILVIKIFKIIEDDQKIHPGNELAAPITPLESELWKNIKKVNDIKGPEERIPDLKIPLATLLIKELWMGRLGTASHQLEKTVLPLGDVIGYTLDGQPIYQKQLKDSSMGTVPIPTEPFKLNLPSEGSIEPRPGNLNRFDSMDLNIPDLQPIKSQGIPKFSPDAAGPNMFESQVDDRILPRGSNLPPDSGRTGRSDATDMAKLIQENSRLMNELSHIKSQAQLRNPAESPGDTYTSKIKSIEPDFQLIDSVKKALSVLQSVVLIPESKLVSKSEQNANHVAIDPILVERLVKVSELAANELKKGTPALATTDGDSKLQIENSNLQSLLEFKDLETKKLKKSLDDMKDLLAKSGGSDPQGIQIARIKALEADIASRDELQQKLSTKLVELQAEVRQKDKDVISLRQDLRNQVPVFPQDTKRELIVDRFVTTDLEDLIKGYLEKGYLSTLSAPRMIVPIEVELINSVIKGSKKMSAVLDNIQAEIADSKKQIEALAKKERNAHEELHQSHIAQKQLQAEVNLLESKLENMSKVFSAPPQESAVAAMVKVLESEVTSRKLEQMKLSNEADSLRSQLASSNAEIDEFRNAQIESACLRQKLDALEAENDSLKKNLESLMNAEMNQTQDPRIKVLDSQLQVKKVEVEELKQHLAQHQINRDKDAKTMEDLKNEMRSLLETKSMMITTQTSTARDPVLESDMRSFIRSNELTGSRSIVPIDPRVMEVEKALVAKLLETAQSLAIKNSRKEDDLAELRLKFEQAVALTGGSIKIGALIERDSPSRELKNERDLRDAAEKNNTKLTAELASIAGTMPKLIAENDSLRKEIGSVTSDLVTLRDKQRSVADQSDREKQQLRTQVSTIEREADGLKKELFDLKLAEANKAKDVAIRPNPPDESAKLAELKLQIENRDRELKDAKDRTNQAEVALIAKNEEITRLKFERDRAISGLEKQTAHDPDILDLLSKIERHTDISKIGDALIGASHSDSVVPKERTLSALKFLLNLFSNFKSAGDEIKVLKENIIDLQLRSQQIETQNTTNLESQKSRIAEREDELKKIKNEKKELDANNTRLNSELADLRHQFEGNQASQKGQLEEIQCLRKTEAELLKEITNLKDINLRSELEILKLGQENARLAGKISRNLADSVEDTDPKLLAEAEKCVSQVFSRKLGEPSPWSGIKSRISSGLLKDLIVCMSILIESLDKSSQEYRRAEEERQTLQSKWQESEQRVKQEEQKVRDERDKFDRMKDAFAKSEKDFTMMISQLNDRLATSVSKQVFVDTLAKAQGEADEKKVICQILENELISLKNELKSKQDRIEMLEKELGEKSTRIIQMESLKSRLGEMEDEKKRQQTQSTRAQENLMDELKTQRQDNQNLRAQLDTVHTRSLELDRLVKQAQTELQDARRRQGEGADNSQAQEEVLRSQESLIRSLQEQDGKSQIELRRLTQQIERYERELETLRSGLSSKTAIETENLRTLAGVKDQLEQVQSDLSRKNKDIQDLERENDSLREKANALKQMLETSLDASEQNMKGRMAQLEMDLERSRITESETSSKILDLANELRMEKNRRISVESELDQSRLNMRKLLIEFDDLKSSQRGLMEKNMELQKKMLVLKADTSMDNKFYDLEDEMNRLKNTNEDLNKKLKEINDELRSTNNKERSLSKENSDLKVKIKSEAIQRIKDQDRSRDPSISMHRESSPPLAEDRDGVAALKTRSLKNVPAPSIQNIDYGPVFDLKMKNNALQQEISIMRNKMVELQNKERLENAKEQTLMESHSKIRGVMISPARKVAAYSTEKGAVERLLEDMEIHTADKSPEFRAIEISNPHLIGLNSSQQVGSQQKDQRYLSLGEWNRLRDDNNSLLYENQQLRNKISLLQSELITVAHNKIPPEFTSPLMVMNQAGEIMNPHNMSQDISELAKNVKKETQAIKELNNTLSRREQMMLMSPGRRGVSGGAGQGVSSSVDKGLEKSLNKRIKELEEKLSIAENLISELQHKLEKKDKRLKEMNDYIHNIEDKGNKRTESLEQENKDLNQKLLILNMQIKELSREYNMFLPRNNTLQKDVEKVMEESRLSISVSGIAQSTKTGGGNTSAPGGLDALREKARHALKKLERHCDGVAKMEATYQTILDSMKGKLKYEGPASERRVKLESYISTIVALQANSSLKSMKDRMYKMKGEEGEIVLQFTQRIKALLETADHDNKGMASELEESSKKLTQLMTGLQKLEPGKTIPPSLRSSTTGPNPAALN